MKLEEGMYVRTKWGIARYIHNLVTKTIIYRVIDKKIVYDNVEDWEDCLLDNEIIKASHNIIDLIEEGDYVNGSKVSIVESEYIYWETGNAIHYKYIETIVTKEQFEAMKYEIK